MAYKLLLSKDESYLIRGAKRKLNTKSGIIDLAEVEKASFGSIVKTHLGKEFVVVKPSLVDFYFKKLKKFWKA